MWFLVLCIFVRLFWKALETLVKQPPGLSLLRTRQNDYYSNVMMTSSNGTFSALLAFSAENSPFTCEFPAQRPVTRSFDVFLICTWINGWVNNREAGDLRRHNAHYDVTVMVLIDISFIVMSMKLNVCVFPWCCIQADKIDKEKSTPSCIDGTQTCAVLPPTDALARYWRQSYISSLWSLICYHWCQMHFPLGQITLIKMTDKTTLLMFCPQSFVYKTVTTRHFFQTTASWYKRYGGSFFCDFNFQNSSMKF